MEQMKGKASKILLEQAFQPLYEKIDRPEQEVKSLREELKTIAFPLLKA
ncbi:hypothetical protein [Ureibacillus thermophilus]|nr:hypothetical protein [Ureibacillus thermophilus]